MRRAVRGLGCAAAALLLCLAAGCDTLDKLSKSLNEAARETNTDADKGARHAGNALNEAADELNEASRKK
jgi:hypothetical protein